MTICEALRLIGPSVPSSEARDEAQILVWQTLQRTVPRDFTEEALELARAKVFERLITREYTLRGRTEVECAAYLRRAVLYAALDIIRKRPPRDPVPPPPPPEPEPPPADCRRLAALLHDIVALWGTDEFRSAREKLLSQNLLRQTSLELIDMATEVRTAHTLMAIGASDTPDQVRRKWGAYKRACQRTIKALLLTVPRICVDRGWAPPDFATLELRALEDITLPPSPSPELADVIRALVAVGTCYQRALAGTAPQAEG